MNIKTDKCNSVLVIEDNQSDFFLLEDFLIEKYHNIKITHSDDFQGAADFLTCNTFALVLLDLHLPDLSGLELIKKVLHHSSKTPVIILTGYSDINLAQKSLKLGVFDFLVKDEINPTLLHKSIEFALSRRSYIEQIEQEIHNYERLFNFSPQPTWLLDLNSLRIINANFSATSHYGYSLAKFKKMSFLDLHPKCEKEIVEKKMKANVKDKRNYDYTHVLQDGEHIDVKIYCGEVKKISQGDVIIVQTNDITETLKYIETIELQNEKLKSIAWTQSHEVRAPLAKILGIIDLINYQNETDPETQFLLEQLKASSCDLDQMIKKIVNKI
ncbi:response regulator [Psychroflexus montanilacus]|uniref:response regulator n=1 Tax=Psychroflexus montanilacus TaxID=2873598 RepID=UPI001CCC1574|nr:response regulator [Psychroflexus montanilacus]MBZ9650930.1 response regulator [Psychroflexus montanilacus]